MKPYLRHTITAALPYTNGPIHLGHMAGVFIPSDIYVRYLRNKGEKVLFISGSDEHGVPITIKAQKEGVSPQEIVDRYHGIIKKSFENFGISFDVYSRTSAKIHHETASDFFKKLDDSGKLQEKTSEQYYDEQAMQFLADRYIKGECPKCGNKEAYGDQCENCGSSLSPNELINPKSALSGSELSKRPTKHWYIPLDHYQEALEEWILEGHKEWKSNVYGQCKSWLKDGDGLRPRAVTRDLDWGVEVPLNDAKGKVLYVWFDAPIGYISATKQWAVENHKDWEIWWKDQHSRLVHFIGKDNIVFHCIIFPAMLMAHGEYILPENVPANEFLNLEGRKLSTSKNWAVWLDDYLTDFPDMQDVLRYVLCANMPETKDSDFTWKDFQTRNNTELVANLGNLINRILVLTSKYFESKVPEWGEATSFDEDLVETIKQAPVKISKALDKYLFREALSELMKLSSAGNEYLAQTEPWHLAKDENKKGELQRSLNLGLQLLANLAILSEPFIPDASSKLKKCLGIDDLEWNMAGRTNLLLAGREIEKLGLLFRRIEDSAVETQLAKLNKQSAKEAQEEKIAALKPEIEFDQFVGMDIRVATIIAAEKVPKTDKLLKLELDLGFEKRTVVSGIAEYHKAEDIIGKQVSLLANLKPRKLRGIMSQGMILMAEDADGRLVFVSPDETVKPGSGIS